MIGELGGTRFHEIFLRQPRCFVLQPDQPDPLGQGRGFRRSEQPGDEYDECYGGNDQAHDPEGTAAIHPESAQAPEGHG
ncbi:MAG: hypothetical protein ACKOBH_02120 [bacterium]